MKDFPAKFQQTFANIHCLKFPFSPFVKPSFLKVIPKNSSCNFSNSKNIAFFEKTWDVVINDVTLFGKLVFSGVVSKIHLKEICRKFIL